MTSSASMRFCKASLISALLMLSSFNVSASNNGHLELSTLTSSDDFDQLISLSLYSPLARTQNYYAVADLTWYRVDTNMDHDFTLRIAAGFTTSSTVAPYLEIGTSFYDLLIIALDDDDDDNSCTTSTSNRCTLDFNIKAGLRYQLPGNLVANAFFQRIKFGNIDNEIEGNFDSFGIGFGYRF